MRIRGTQGSDLLLGGSTDDLLQGFGDTDAIYARAGNDRVFGGWGRDYLYGQSGDDLILGGKGGDSMEGGSGNDVIYGEEGNDTLIGGSGIDDLYGDQGQDLLLSDAQDTLHFQATGYRDLGHDTVRGPFAALDIYLEGYDADGNLSVIEARGFLDNTGDGMVTDADQWADNVNGDLVLDLEGLADTVLATDTNAASVTLKGYGAGIAADLIQLQAGRILDGIQLIDAPEV